MEYGLEGKTAIVTGASQGIGREIAAALHREGAAVAIVGQTHERLHATARAIAQAGAENQAPVYPIVGDLSVRAEVDRVARQAIERLGHVDILVNNAARARTGNFFELREEELQEVWEVKGFGYVRMVRAIAPHMMQRRSGSIINIIGTAARTPTEDFIIGSMVNAALVNFTRGLSRTLGRHNVRINAISPGWTRTERQQRVFELQAAAQHLPVEEIERREARAIPLQRLVSMEEIATLVLLLASDKLPAVTGEDIAVDGGAAPSI